MKKWSLANLCAYLSLAISVSLLVLWCCNVGGFTVVSLDSFVGVIVALLAIIVTLAIGWQIYNSIELNERIKKLNTLEERLISQDKTLKQQNNKSNHLISYIYGIEAKREKEYLEAFRYYMASLRCSMLLDKPINIDHLLKDLEKVNVVIKDGTMCEFERLNEIREYDIAIRKSYSYDIIKSRYERIYNIFCTKVKDGNNG
jgi:hypothetical protein